jgi:hypothetical protein
LRTRREKKKALRRANRKCKYIEHQAHDSGDSESNSSDLDDASNDSCVTSNSDASDGNYEIYALGMSSQAEAAGFTLPLHQTRFADRESLADMILRNRDARIRSGRILESAPLTLFEQYVTRIRDGVGVLCCAPHDATEQDLPLLVFDLPVQVLPPAPVAIIVPKPTPFPMFVLPSGRVRIPGRLQLPRAPKAASKSLVGDIAEIDIPPVTCDAFSLVGANPPFECVVPANSSLHASSPPFDIPPLLCEPIPQATYDASSLVVTNPPFECDVPDNPALTASPTPLFLSTPALKVPPVFPSYASSPPLFLFTPALGVVPLVPFDIPPLMCDQAVQTSPVKETPLTREGLRDELQALLLSLGL